MSTGGACSLIASLAARATSRVSFSRARLRSMTSVGTTYTGPSLRKSVDGLLGSAPSPDPGGRGFETRRRRPRSRESSRAGAAAAAGDVGDDDGDVAGDVAGEQTSTTNVVPPSVVVDGADAYQILGVDVTASKRAVRKAFRNLAKTAHPDRGGSAEVFDLLKTAAEELTDDDSRAALDAKLLDVAVGSLALQELRWSRELAGLAEAEDDGEVRGADAVLASARAYAAAEKALAAVAAKRKKEEAREEMEKKVAALEAANAARRRVAAAIAKDGTRGPDAEATLVITRDMLVTAGEDNPGVEGGAGLFALEAEVEVNCPRCNGWGEKEGHWTMAVDKLCPKCKGRCRVPTTRRVRVPVRDDVMDGERVVVFGAGHGGLAKQLDVLGKMGPEGEAGDLNVTIAVLREGETTRRA